jgi:hypothetical protein
MNGFFANLAARALDAKDAVRPRLPSRFEPAETGPALPSAVIERVAEREWVEGGMPRDAGRAPVTANAAPLLVVPRRITAQPIAEPRADSVERNDRPVAVPKLERAAGADAATGGTAVRATRRAPEGPEPAAVSTRDARGDAEAHPERGAAKIRHDPAARVAASEGVMQPQPVREPRSAESGRAPATHAVHPATEVANVVPAPPAAAAIAPHRFAAPERRPPVSVRHAPETRIQVSIGRVEVRATAPPVQGRRDAAAPAVMSLGEYLRSRAESAR